MIYIGYWLVSFWTLPKYQIFTNQFCTITLHLKKNLHICVLFFNCNIIDFEWFRTFRKYLHIKKNIEVFLILKKKFMICFIRGRKNHQSWETVLVTKLCLCQKNQKHPLKLKLWTKKTWLPRFLEYAERHVFVKSNIFFRVSLVFCQRTALFWLH